MTFNLYLSTYILAFLRKVPVTPFHFNRIYICAFSLDKSVLSFLSPLFYFSHNRNNKVTVPKMCVENFVTHKRHSDDEKRFKSLFGIFIQPLYDLMDSNRFLYFLQCKGFYGLFCVRCCCLWFFFYVWMALGARWFVALRTSKKSGFFVFSAYDVFRSWLM